MSVENRIFWLLIGILGLYLVFSAAGRTAVNRFVYAIFGYQPGGGGATPPPPAVPGRSPTIPQQNPDGTFQTPTTPPSYWFPAPAQPPASSSDMKIPPSYWSPPKGWSGSYLDLIPPASS